MTVRQLINDIINTIHPNIHAVEATDKMVELSRLLGNINEVITQNDKIFISKKVEIMEANEKMSMNKVELLAQNTDEYHALQEARRLEKATLEVIRSLKFRCKALEDEYTISNH